MRDMRQEIVYTHAVTDVKAETTSVPSHTSDVPVDRAREGVGGLHTAVRQWILDGTLEPGASLSQVELSQRLGVSRTPLREVLRMLQEEGLVIAETNLRVRVADFDPETLDADYACRILLESLALDLTVPGLTRADCETLATMLDTMGTAAAGSDVTSWFATHAEFHGILTRGASPALRKEIRTYADRSIRYIRVVQHSEPDAWQAPGDREHRTIVEAITAGDAAQARSVLAHHLARTALRALTDLAPQFEPVAVRRALAMATVSAPLR